MAKTRSISISDAVSESRISLFGLSKSVTLALSRIEKLIGSGRYPPGARLVEADLVREVGIGRGPVREAIRILAGDGVLELSPNRGARVRMFDQQQFTEMIQVLVGLFCIAVDLFIAQLPNPRAMTALRTMAGNIKAASRAGDKRALAADLTDYHQIVVHFTGNRYLHYLLQRIHVSHYLLNLDEKLETATLRTIALAYDEITRALEAGDGTTVKRILNEQLSRVVLSLKSKPSLFDEALEPLVRKGAERPSRNRARA